MTSFTLLPATQRAPRPWKNKGGVTHEVAVSPVGATLDDFDWRLSIAMVSAPSPFSRFIGIDRILAVLSGVLDLDFAKATGAVRLTSTSAPFAFPGDARLAGAPVGGEVMDLNIMVRRDRYSCTMTRLPGQCRQHVVLHPGTTVLVACGPAIVMGDAMHVHMEAWDALRLDLAYEGASVALASDDAMLVVHLTAKL